MRISLSVITQKNSMKTMKLRRKISNPFASEHLKFRKRCGSESKWGHFGALLQESLYHYICKMDSRGALVVL